MSTVNESFDDNTVSRSHSSSPEFWFAWTWLDQQFGWLHWNDCPQVLLLTNGQTRKVQWKQLPADLVGQKGQQSLEHSTYNFFCEMLINSWKALFVISSSDMCFSNYYTWWQRQIIIRKKIKLYKTEKKNLKTV